MDAWIKSFQTLDVENGDVDVEELVKQEFPQRFNIPWEEKLLTPGGSNANGQAKPLLDELVQHLVDLDYLPFEFYDEYHEAQGQLPAAMSQQICDAVNVFFDEDPVLAQCGMTPDHLDWEDLTSVNDILPFLVQRLNLLTNLDGEFFIDKPLLIGERNALTRVLHYRLQALGIAFSDEGVSGPIDNLSIIGALKVLVLTGKKERILPADIGQEISPKLFATTSNVHLLFKDFCQSHGSKLLVYKHLEPGMKPVADFENFIVHDGDFFYDDKEKAFFRKIRNRTDLDPTSVRDFIASRGKPENLTHTDANLFGIRLLQLKLWMYGFYFGRVDGNYQNLSHESFKDFLEQEEKERRHDDYLLPVTGGFWAVNLPKTLELFKDYDEQNDKEEAQEEQLQDLLKEIPDAQVEQHLSNPGPELTAFMNEGKRRQRRNYHGLRSLWASAMRGLRKVKNWLKKAAQKVAGAVVSFFKSLTKFIGEGLRIFYRAMRRFAIFVMRKPIISPENHRDCPPDTAFILTRFDLDFDVVNFRSTLCDAAFEKNHFRIVRNMCSGLRLFLRIADLAISLIRSLAPPLGWVRLAIRLGRLIMALLRQQMTKTGMMLGMRNEG